MLPDDLTHEREECVQAKRAEEDRAEEERAEHLLNTTSELSQDEVDAIYCKVWPNEDSRQRAFASARQAEGLCKKEQRQQPPQLKAASAQLAQMELGLPETKLATARVLLIDQDACRLVERRKLLSDLKIETMVATTAADAVAVLEAKRFQLVIVDYHPVTEEDRRYLLEVQEFNLQVPVINVQAWAGILERDNRRLNRDLLRAVTRILRKPIPRRLPMRRSPATALKLVSGQPGLDIG